MLQMQLGCTWRMQLWQRDARINAKQNERASVRHIEFFFIGFESGNLLAHLGAFDAEPIQLSQGASSSVV
jgi:hypothetical protein